MTAGLTSRLRNGEGGISVLLNRGDGSFQARGTTEPQAPDLAIGDLNGDGSLTSRLRTTFERSRLGAS